MKDIYEQMKEKMENSRTIVKYDPQNTDWKKLIKEAFFQPVLKERKTQIYLPVFDYPSLSDEQFIAFIEGAKKPSSYVDYVFQGGSEGFKLFRARCERLNIKLD